MKLQFIKTLENAVVPSRAYDTDVGLDLVAVREHKTLPNGVVLFDTGIAVKPPSGYYVEIVPRSSISKSGWVLANSVGTIDPTYNGNLFIALAKVVESAEKPVVPFCLTQMVLRKVEYCDMEQVESFQETQRGDGGFGSTGSRNQ